jgi:hypothetical protein
MPLLLLLVASICYTEYRWIQAGAYQPFFRGHAHHDRYMPLLILTVVITRLLQALSFSVLYNTTHTVLYGLRETDLLVCTCAVPVLYTTTAANGASLGCLVSHGQQGIY